MLLNKDNCLGLYLGSIEGWAKAFLILEHTLE